MKLSNIKIKIENWYYKHIKKLDENEFKNNLIVKENNHTVVFIDGQDYIPEMVETSNKTLKIKSLEQYREALKEGITDFDFSELNTNGEDIQNLNLENRNLKINLRTIFVPYGGSHKMGNACLRPLISYGECFLYLNYANLKGNCVTGDLQPFCDGNKRPVYFWYNENTFDETYKANYPNYFLNENAPQELKDRYYNPQIITKIKPTIFNPEGEEITYLKRQTLSFEEYMNYYEYLKNKYLGNFDISMEDRMKINIIENFGLEQAKEMFIYLSNNPLPLNLCFQMLSQMDSTTLSSVFNKTFKGKNLTETEEILKTIEEVCRKRKK